MGATLLNRPQYPSFPFHPDGYSPLICLEVVWYFEDYLILSFKWWSVYVTNTSTSSVNTNWFQLIYLQSS